MNRFSVVHVSAWLPLVLPLAFGVSCERAAESHPEPDGEAVEVPESNPRLPGFASVDEALQTRLGRALASKGPAYVPRTRHLDESGAPKYTNRLIEQGSPYLLQHAHNPVSWYAWSDEAFERAKRENKPIFLSIGYSTCHWCHVMERESFEDEQIAEFLNRHFIAIKVDREERPDIDSVYMSAVNILTGRGGWPMTIVMTPDKEPFFAGTYFPPHEGVRGSGAGLSDILAEMLRVYTNQPQQVVARAQELSQRIEQVASIRAGPGVPSDKTIAIAAQQYATMFDRVDGGFTGAPKFPQPSRLLLLLRYARRTGDDGATAMVATTLDRMAAGGIYDQIGGGFHRYSTDAEWLVPHFEKMLYDNAQLALVYIETWQVTSDSDYSRVAREILDYVAREMISPDGGFYSATDADSPTPEGHEEEGWFYTWTPAELESFLGADDVRIVSAAYGVTEGGNFEGRNILHRVLSDRELASGLRVPRRRVSEVLNSARKILYAARTLRPAPLRDEKIIAAWNGMMISAFAKVGWALGEHSYTQIAERAAKFVLERMRARDGSLVRTHSGGGTGGASFLDDYAFMIAASLDLYETTGDQAWLERAIGLQTEQDLRYGDSEGGGYYLTPRGGETLLVREKPTYDGAVPSGNSVAASNLLRLHDLTGAESWRQKAERLFAMLGFRVTRSPTEYPLLLTALDHYYDKPLEVAVIAATNREDAAPLSRPLRETFVPNKAFVVLASDDAVEQTTKVPWLEGKVAIAGKSTAYVCERGSCALPTSDASVLQRQLGRSVPYPSFAKEPPPRLPFKRSN